MMQLQKNIILFCILKYIKLSIIDLIKPIFVSKTGLPSANN